MCAIDLQFMLKSEINKTRVFLERDKDCGTSVKLAPLFAAETVR